MPVEVRLHPNAEWELRAAYIWYLERNPIVAEAFQIEADHAVQVVSEHPERWPHLTESIQRYVFPRFPFSLIYQARSQWLEVVAIAHQKRKPDYWTER